ncbi:MAG: hypothetical protein HQ464_17205 [Planctomycetes bacterium]|nr:hypothetical protein [Planctomycetota bacterium]
MSKKDLIKLNKDKILKSNNKKGANTLLTIALIRNGISDLVYLQGLFASDNKNIKNEVSAKLGQYAGGYRFLLEQKIRKKLGSDAC